MKEHILIIDDDPSVRKAFHLALEDEPYVVQDASSGEEGIIQISKQKYNLIFLDLKMPGLNGTETLRKLRKVDSQVSIYILTAFHKEFLQDLQKLRKDGLKFELLRKPLGSDEILMIVRSILKQPLTY